MVRCQPVLGHFAHLHQGGPDPGESEGAVGSRDHAGLAGVQHPVEVHIQEYRPAGQGGLAGVPGAVGVQIIELNAVDFTGLEVSEIASPWRFGLPANCTS